MPFHTKATSGSVFCAESHVVLLSNRALTSKQPWSCTWRRLLLLVMMTAVQLFYHAFRNNVVFLLWVLFFVSCVGRIIWTG